MPPNKRRQSPGSVQHHGRVTSHRVEETLPATYAPRPVANKRTARSQDGPAASSRYTPPLKSVRFRPDWHKWVGRLILLAGLAVIVLNDLVLLGGPEVRLPGGHSELYLLLGVSIAGYSTWWFGWFDRES